MHVVAIRSLTEDKESLGGKLAAALGVTAFEALARLRIPGSGPLVVAVYREPAPARRLVGNLQSAGFGAVLLTAGEIATEADRPSARRFRLDEEKLHVESAGEGSFDVAYRDVNLILRGTRIALSTFTETVKKRSFSPGRAVLSGGLMLSRTTKTARETAIEEREGFFVLYAREGTALTFSEKGVVYDSLGAALQPARAANFAYLARELRRRCLDAVYDERLLTRAAQAALLGPRLSPETHLDVATCLLAKVLRRRDSEPPAA
ncbi:MAG: hypothetical protein P8013_10455 [Candidatus Sulfobium sp.]|jgi:hypothetical protein